MFNFTFFGPTTSIAAVNRRPTLLTVRNSITMKRKLDQNDEPSSPAKVDEGGRAPEQKEASQPGQSHSNAEPSFAELGLDPRLVQAIAKQAFEKPTLVQRKAIPLALQGQDVLC